MAGIDLYEIVNADWRSWPKPIAELLPERDRTSYVNRCDALICVAGGASFHSAGKLNGVDERTVRKDAAEALKPHLDGTVVGFRACLPYRRSSEPRSKPPTAPPQHKNANAMTQLIASTESVRELVTAYNGPLPTGKVKCRRFDRHCREVLAAVETANGTKGYPFNVPDRGRRALSNYHKRKRKERLDAGAAEVDTTPPAIARLSQLFQLAPLERLEFDAHKEDVDWHMELLRPDGLTVTRRIQCVTLIVVICAVTRYVVAYVLVLGVYNRLDVLRLVAKALQPWRPRELIVPGMRYADGAQLGVPVTSSGSGPRGILIAGDNAMQHHADISVKNILKHQRGVLHLGRAHVPEIRPIIEAFFRRLAEGALRFLAGGFQPETQSNGQKTPTSFLRAQDHPLHWEGMLDLMDVILSGHNVTPHSGLHNRTPASVLNTHLASGWYWESTEFPRDAGQLATIRFNVKIRGDKRTGRHPFVQYQEAYYRSQRLMGRHDLVGKSFIAEANVDDLRDLVLIDPDDATVWSRLKALPPWDLTPHDLHLRHQIIRAKNRGLVEIVGARDAVAAYHEFARSQVIRGDAPPDLYARVDQCVQRGSKRPAPEVRPVVLPRSGRTSFAGRKD